jgi:hypothetical protein
MKNFKVKCVGSECPILFKAGNTYEVINGILYCEIGEFSTGHFVVNDLNDINKNTNALFVLA